MYGLDKEKLIRLPHIDLGEFYLRPIQYEDIEDMYDYGKDKRVTKTLDWEYNCLKDAEKSMIKVHLSRPDKGSPLPYALVLKETDKMIGTCDFLWVDWNSLIGELGYVLHYDYWGKGFMTKACKALIDFGFHYLKLDKIYASHGIENVRSQKVIEKCGFKYKYEDIHRRYGELHRFYEIQARDYLKEEYKEE